MSSSGYSVAGRNVIITGASSGIGESSARLLLESGANVCIVGRDKERLEAAIERLGATEGRALAVAADLGDPGSPERVVERTVAEFGSVDGLVNNAATIEPQTLDQLTPEAAAHQWQVNVAAPLFLTKAAVEHMGEGGSIVFISSTCVMAGMGSIGVYTATKGALAGLSRSLADELSPRGIRVNTVSPGWIKTPTVAPQFEANPAFEDLIVSRSLVGRIGHPDDLAHLIVYLLSPEASYVTGANMVADGGASTSMNLR